MNKDMKQGLAIGVAFASLVAIMPTKAEEVAPEDVAIGAGVATATVAGIASAAAPAVVAHSSGMAIMYSGAGYVAGTIGMAAGTVALLPAVAVGGVAVATGAVIYKYSDEIGAWYTETFDSEEEQ